jgi:hypothetical protein
MSLRSISPSVPRPDWTRWNSRTSSPAFRNPTSRSRRAPSGSRKTSEGQLATP